MPIYLYECPRGHQTEELRKVDGRHDPVSCPQCGKASTLVVTGAHLDNLGMGLDSGFPTAFDRWGKLQQSKNTGRQWDSNNRRYGGDWERKK